MFVYSNNIRIYVFLADLSGQGKVGAAAMLPIVDAGRARANMPLSPASERRSDYPARCVVSRHAASLADELNGSQ
jgi:hypothetical protein